MENNLPKLIDAILQSWTKCLRPPYINGIEGVFTPANGITYCNRYVAEVAKAMGFDKFGSMRANQMFDYLSTEKDGWVKISGVAAAEYANKGVFVVAAWKNPDAGVSGHVAVVRPGMPCTSKKWNYPIPSVPMVANVGGAERCRLDRGANWAFNIEPNYFAWNGKNEK